MNLDSAVWRKARELIERFCENAALYAAMKADACLREGDVDGERWWKRVLAAILKIRLAMPVDGERLN